MATFAEINTLASNPDFQARVKVAMVKSAQSILGEAIGSMTQAQTNKRQATAQAVMSFGVNVFQWALAVAINPSITISSNDGDIEFTVNSIWDDMSGVTSVDLV